MERMIKAGCVATSDFEWLSQLRFVFSREDGPFGICSVRQTNCQLEYSYEYQASRCDGYSDYVCQSFIFISEYVPACGCSFA